MIMAKIPTAGGENQDAVVPTVHHRRRGKMLFEALLRDTIQLAAGLRYSIGNSYELRSLLAGLFFIDQSPWAHCLLLKGANIGICLEGAWEGLLDGKIKKVIALNADGPSLPREYLAEAFRLLDSNDAGAGAGRRWGYDLVGCKEMNADIFADIPWSIPPPTQTLALTAQWGSDSAYTYLV